MRNTFFLLLFTTLFISSCSPSDSGDNNNNQTGSSGVLDTHFGINGVSYVDFDNYQAIATASAIQSDGKLIIAGTASTVANNYDGNFALARLNTNGTLDNSFSYDGKLLTPFSTASNIVHYAMCWCIGVLPDGKIIAAGESSSSTTSFTIAKYNSDGSLDNSFGSNGTMEDQIETSSPVVTQNISSARSIYVQNDGKFILCGTSITHDVNNGNYLKLALVRYNSDGSHDNTFGINGKTFITLNNNPAAFNIYGPEELDMKLINDSNKLTVIITKNSTTDFNDIDSRNILRFNNDGSLDTSFGNGGRINSSTGLINTINASICKQLNGNYVTVGWNSSNNFCALSYTTAGIISNDFGINGVFTTAFGSTNEDKAFDAAVQSDGKIILCGTTTDQTYGTTDLVLCRIENNGNLDTTFGTAGKVKNHIDGTNQSEQNILLDTEGRIIVFTTIYGTAQIHNSFVITRYLK